MKKGGREGWGIKEKEDKWEAREMKEKEGSGMKEKKEGREEMDWKKREKC